jgi:t-SNARE complex subunit (syntaxin)
VERRSLLVVGVTVDTAWGRETVNAAVDVARSERRKNTAFVCIDIILVGSIVALIYRLFSIGPTARRCINVRI